MIKRNLDGVYFRIQRDGKWDSICFTDLTDDEMDEVLKGRGREWILGLAKILAKTIQNIGYQFDLVGKNTVDDEEDNEDE